MMLKLCNFSVKYKSYKQVKKTFRIYNANHTCLYWSKKGYIVESWKAEEF